MAKTQIPTDQAEDKLDTNEEQLDAKETLKKVIKVGVKDVGVLRKALTISVPRESIDTELNKEYKELVAEALVPGFRRGRAPRRLVEKRFGSEVGSQVQTRLISNAYLAAIEKEDLKVLGDPLVWVKQKDKKADGKEDSERLTDMATALQHMDLPEDGQLEFRCEVEVKPEFKLPELDGVEIEKPQLKITDEDVNVQVDRIRAHRGQWVPVADGPVKADDLLVCDLTVTVDGKEVKKSENVQVAARPQQIEGVIIEDLGDVLKGAKVGQSRTVEGELPADYENPDVRGKKAKFELKINDIKRLELPPLDKEYLESQGFDSEAEFREWVRKRMDAELHQEVQRGMRNQVRKYLLDETKLELPEQLSGRQTERAVVRMMVDLQRQGVPMAEIEKHADELRTSAREQALSELKLHFVLEEIAEKQEVEVTEEEINGQIAAMARSYNRRFDRVRDDLARNNGIEALYLQIRDDKCIDKILEKAKHVEPKKRSEEKEPKKTEKSAEKEKAAAPAKKPEAKAEKPKAAAPKAAAKDAPKKKSK